MGDQTGGRVFLFLRTDDFWRDYHALRGRGVRFAEGPREEDYGTVAEFLLLPQLRLPGHRVVTLKGVRPP